MRTSKSWLIAGTAFMTAGVASAAAAGLIAASAAAAPGQNFPSYSVKTILNGAGLTHHNSRTGKKEALSKPDDLTFFGGDLFTAFQNGVGPQGEPSTTNNADSTVVEFTPGGSVVAQWDLRGKIDGLTANPATGEVIATVNEDLHSSLYSIEPGGEVIHYQYSKPLPHNGGTDAISFFKGQMLVSASAPGTTGAAAPNAKYPAVYSVTLNQITRVATAKPYYYDEAGARLANQHLGAHIKLALTDPDSSEVVPWSAPRFRGNFVLNSQGDQELIFSWDPGSRWVLRLPRSVDDTAWATSWDGKLYATDSSADKVVVVNSRKFWPGTAFVAVTPCNANSAPATCPAPPKFPANYLGLLNMYTGQIIPVELHGGTLHPVSLVFVDS
ncbi:MAG TPA: hypothetical protein VF070_16810 [Streptosporangiaceae bacterium]